MADSSSIEWTEATWNPVTGCVKISPGCKHCYAERLAGRLKAMGSPRYASGFETAFHPEALLAPTRWKRSRMIFVNSMSDLFQDEVPLSFIKQVFEVMEACPQHTFQVLTKRPHLARAASTELPWPPNVWMGTSVEHPDYLHRVRELQQVPAAVRFLSLEPLLARFPRLTLSGIHWVIVGGESGPGARPIEPEWVREIRRHCERSQVAFFFKQWGGVNKKRTGRLLDGRTWDEFPTPVMA